ncbi:hypothetical protein GOBAR_AA14040 [Gossypium barbadense]|uniref:Uncharacterized protein n=1 Tax=Gossypium barbadense TaxID=3634 RepID=A0A2P5XTG6_GOSBA|nr:hypothetical protein GOBAR_AA14040 [Gossypium barbadense]
MELVDDEDVETMIALYCGNQSDKNAPIHLFAELASLEQNENFTAYGEEHGAKEPCMVAPISHVGSESTIRRIDINLNVTSDIYVVGDDGYDSSDPCDQEVDSDGYPNVDEIRRIVIHNNPVPHMLLIDPDAVHVAEFPEYLEILSTHWLTVNSSPEELFVGQIFESKEECIFAIKRTIPVSIAIRLFDVPWRSVYCIWHIAANFHRDYKNAEWWRQVVRIAHELEPDIFRQRMTRLESDMEGQTNTSF